MSDREGHSGVAGDDDLSLPKATVSKMISGIALWLSNPHLTLLTDSSSLELLPNDIACAKETRDLVIECCVGEANTPA